MNAPLRHCCSATPCVRCDELSVPLRAASSQQVHAADKVVCDDDAYVHQARNAPAGPSLQPVSPHAQKAPLLIEARTQQQTVASARVSFVTEDREAGSLDHACFAMRTA